MPEYHGNYPRMVGFQFPATGTLRRGPARFDIRFSALSGVLALVDMRGAALSKYGWDTGFARVLALDHGRMTANGVDYLGSGWDAAMGRSKLFRLTVPNVGAPTQQATSIVSNTNEIWAAADEIGDQILIYDVQNHSILRYFDTNTDGVADSRDQLFYVAVPQDVATSRTALRINPIGGFVAADGAIAEIITNDVLTRGSQKVLLVVGQNGPSIGYGPSTPMPSRGQIIGDVVAGQRRLMVAGPAGFEFKIVRQVAGSADLPISSNWTIPIEKFAYVDLTMSLTAMTLIRIVPVNQGESSGWVVVNSSTNAVLFPIPTPTFAPNQATQLLLEGDKFRAGFVAVARREGASGVVETPLATTFLSSRQLRITLPLIGTAGATPPLTKSSYIAIFLRNSQTGSDVSNTIIAEVKHD